MVVSGKIHFNDGYIDDQTISLTQNGTDCAAYVSFGTNFLNRRHAPTLKVFHIMTTTLTIVIFTIWVTFGKHSFHASARLGIPFTESVGQCRFQPPAGQQDSYCNMQ